MRILVLCGDYWHPAEIPRQGLSRLEEFVFEFEWIESASEWSAERMNSFPATIMSKANQVSATDQNPWMNETIQQVFLEYVRGGHGLLVIHSGAVGCEQLPIVRSLMGGAFREHPPQCQVILEPHGGHPLAVGCESISMMDEHYFMDIDDDQIDIFLSTTSEHGTQPGGWTRFEGEGRVCVLTPGHNLEVWEHPAYQTLLYNALRWCSKTY